MKRRLFQSLTALALLAASANAISATHTGLIHRIETWANGNVAFVLSGVGACNGQFILNASSPGTKNFYAMLLAAKGSGQQVSVSQSTCITAEGYSPTVLYANVDYITLQ